MPEKNGFFLLLLMWYGFWKKNQSLLSCGKFFAYLGWLKQQSEITSKIVFFYGCIFKKQLFHLWPCSLDHLYSLLHMTARIETSGALMAPVFIRGAQLYDDRNDLNLCMVQPNELDQPNLNWPKFLTVMTNTIQLYPNFVLTKLS